MKDETLHWMTLVLKDVIVMTFINFVLGKDFNLVKVEKEILYIKVTIIFKVKDVIKEVSLSNVFKENYYKKMIIV